MKRRFPSSAERRNADLFFADLMGFPSVAPGSASRARSPAEDLSELFGETEGEWGEATSCPSKEEVRATFHTLKELEKLIKATQTELESNPLYLEVQMLTELSKVIDMAREVPAKAWREIWDELKAFADCDVKPLVARVKKGEKHANAVLRVLNGLSSILQGYVHDRIDAQFKNKLESKTGWSKLVAKALIFLLKKQVPVIQREIKAGNFAAVATAFDDLKKQLEGQGFSVTGVWDIVVALGKEIIGEAIEDAIKNSARWVAKKVAKKLLGSAAKAASVIFILEDLVLFVHALAHISNLKERQWAYNRVLLTFLARVRRCVAVRAGEQSKAYVAWKRHFARIDCQLVINSFAPVKGGKPGEGEWHAATVHTTIARKPAAIVRFDVPDTEPVGQRELPFQVPPVAKWPVTGDSYVSMNVAWFDAKDNLLGTRSLWVAACVP